MFVVNARIRKGHLIFFVLLCAAALSVVILMSGNADGGASYSPLRTIDGKTVSFKNINSGEARLSFIVSLGWSVSAEPYEVEEVIIPSEFDAVFDGYNAIQLEQGFDLSKYKGKRVKRYTYLLDAHPSGEENVRLNLLIYKDRIIGGDICSSRLDGFMHGLGYPRE